MREEPAACPGSYRTDPAFISSNPAEVLAAPSEIDSLVEKVFKYINETDDHPVEVITNVHAWLIRIHPFADGNGRVIRLVLTFLAMNFGYTGIAFKCGVEEYFNAIRSWTENPGSFGTLVLKELLEMSDLYEKARIAAERMAKMKSSKVFSIVR